MPGLKEMIDRTILPGVYHGIKTTLTHLVTPRSRKIMPTIQYPEEKAPTFKRTRGIHFMKCDDDGRANCVACFLCSTACPADAITIEQTHAPEEWVGRDTYPASYVIDELRCIFCGSCEEACPKDAIHLSNTHAPVFHDRESAIHDLGRLMDHWTQVRDTGRVTTG